MLSGYLDPVFFILYFGSHDWRTQCFFHCRLWAVCCQAAAAEAEAETGEPGEGDEKDEASGSDESEADEEEAMSEIVVPSGPSVPTFQLSSLAEGALAPKKKAKPRAKPKDDEDDIVDCGDTDGGDEVWQEIQSDVLLQQVAKALGDRLGGAAPNCLVGLLPTKTFEESAKVGHQLRGVPRLQSLLSNTHCSYCSNST